jgi:hypothetical protein
VQRWLLVVGMALALGMAGPARADDVTFDFRGQNVDVEKRFVYAPNKAVADSYFHHEDKGLRIAWSAVDTPRDPVGLVWTHRGFLGDFLASVHFEILKADPSANGTGVELYLQLGNATLDGMPFSCLIRGKDEEAIWVSQMRAGPRDQRKTEGYRLVKAAKNVNRGWLKLQRKGDIVTASYAEGDEESYKELNTYNIGPVGIRMVRIAGLASGSKAAQLNLRIIDARLKIDGEAMPASATLSARGPGEETRTALWAVLILGTLSLFIFLAVFTFVKRKKSKVDAPAESSATNPAEVLETESASVNAQGQPIRVDCPVCGKKLKLKDKLAGKRVKCPQCGGELRVPS